MLFPNIDKILFSVPKVWNTIMCMHFIQLYIRTYKYLDCSPEYVISECKNHSVEAVMLIRTLLPGFNGI